VTTDEKSFVGRSFSHGDNHSPAVFLDLFRNMRKPFRKERPAGQDRRQYRGRGAPCRKRRRRIQKFGRRRRTDRLDTRRIRQLRLRVGVLWEDRSVSASDAVYSLVISPKGGTYSEKAGITVSDSSGRTLFSMDVGAMGGDGG
jgi:hypothetical protein